jgi:hypothetical protein
LYLKIPTHPWRDTVKRKVREKQEKEEGGPYPPSPRLLEGILLPLMWVYAYLNNARYTERALYSLQKWSRINRPGPPVALQLELAWGGRKDEGFILSDRHKLDPLPPLPHLRLIHLHVA